jgi:Tol biopolymer transport system component/DNA-binding winged helix-turn-helix (wHTH) protein
LRSQHLFRFEDFRLLADESKLYKGEEQVALTPKMYDLLRVLVQYHGRILEKEFLLQEVWPDSFVEEGNISFNIRQLRKALDDDAQTPRFIETIPRKGYRFVAPVEEVTAANEATEDTIRADAHKLRLFGSKRFLVLVLFIVFAILAGSAVLFWFLKGRGVEAAPILSTPFASERLTTDGEIFSVVISRDGKTIVYSRRNAGKESLWVVQPGKPDTTAIVAPSDYKYFGIALSPDGTNVYFARSSGTEPQADIYRASIFGGVPERIISQTQGWISVSPDGEKISFVRCPYEDQEYCSLWIANASDGKNERELVSRPSPFRIGDNKISPDGKTVAFAVGQSRTSSNEFGLAEVDIESAKEHDLAPNRFFNIEYLSWLPDQKDILLTARQLPDKNFRIWRLTEASGEATALTDDSQSYSALSLNDAGNLLVTSQVAPNFHLDLYSVGNAPALPKHVVNSLAVTFAPNGELVFSSHRTGNYEIWRINSDGSDERQLTEDPADDVAPIVSADGAVIYYATNRTGKIQVWKMRWDGSNQTQVTFGDGGYPLNISPDDQWLYYRSALEKTLKRVSLQDGREELVFDKPGAYSALSPADDQLAWAENVNGQNTLKIISLSEKNAVRTLRTDAPSDKLAGLAWSHDGKSLAYVLDNGPNAHESLWLQPINGEAPRKIGDLNGEVVYELAGLAFSLNDQAVAVSQGAWDHDAILLKGLK